MRVIVAVYSLRNFRIDGRAILDNVPGVLCLVYFIQGVVSTWEVQPYRIPVAVIRRIHCAGDIDLVHVGLALGQFGFGFGGGECRQQHRRQDGDNGDHTSNSISVTQLVAELAFIHIKNIPRFIT